MTGDYKRTSENIALTSSDLVFTLAVVTFLVVNPTIHTILNFGQGPVVHLQRLHFKRISLYEDIITNHNHIM